MSYAHIENLYKNTTILLLRECYALEKVHGTSAHFGLGRHGLHFFAGGAKHEHFVALFDQDALLAGLLALEQPAMRVYGEAYGGKMQGMGKTYGPDLRFIAFDVQIGESWLSVPDAERIVLGLGLEFVPYERVSTDLEALDRERDRPSVVAEWRGCGSARPREGIVLRPLVTLTTNNGERVCAKHKRAEFAERTHPPRVCDAAAMQMMADAQAIAAEWVTAQRLRHVVDHLRCDPIPENLGRIIPAMIEDVQREGAGEIVWTPAVAKEVGKATALLVKRRVSC